MSVQIVSTTDSDEAVLAATGGLAKNNESEETKSASSKDVKASKQDEITEDSETSEELEDSESTDDEDIKDDKEDQKPKKKGGFQKRIERFQKKLSEKDQALFEKDQIIARLSEKRAGNPDELKPEKVESLKSSDSKPKSENFDTHEEYVDALTDWKLEQKEKEREQKSRENQIKTEQQKKVSDFQAKVQEFQKSHDDFDEVVSDVDDIPLSFALRDAIVTSDLGPQVMYELAQNRDELTRINSLSLVDAAREIGKIEARLSQESSSVKKIKTITKAPPPIEPVGSKGSARVEKSPDDMSFNEFKKWRESKK